VPLFGCVCCLRVEGPSPNRHHRLRQSVGLYLVVMGVDFHFVMRYQNKHQREILELFSSCCWTTGQREGKPEVLAWNARGIKPRDNVFKFQVKLRCCEFVSAAIVVEAVNDQIGLTAEGNVHLKALY